MELELKQTAESGDINAFYGVVEREPGILKAIEAKDFVETPLHVAASHGKTELAIEILNLKPSFGRKLNPSGYRPLDMALHNGQRETVKQLIKFDPELIGLRSRERKTPLHYAAETDDADLVAEFLVACPTAVKQLTIRGETAVHLAVLTRSTNAFNVLMGWITRTDNKKILGWKDNRGNTVLHIAADTGQVEVIERLIKVKVNLHGRNQANQTALDVDSSAEIQNLLRRAGALRSPELHDDRTYKDILAGKFWKGYKGTAWTVDLNKGIADGTRNAFLVATVLIATTTFQAVLSPPGGGWLSKEDDTNYVNSNPTNLPAPPPDTTVELNDGVKFKGDIGNFYLFLFLNTITFGSSLGLTFLLMPLRHYLSRLILIRCSIFSLLLTYAVCVVIITPVGANRLVVLSMIFTGAIIFHLAAQVIFLPPVELIKPPWLRFRSSKEDARLSQLYEMEMQVRLGKYEDKR